MNGFETQHTNSHVYMVGKYWVATKVSISVTGISYEYLCMYVYLNDMS